MGAPYIYDISRLRVKDLHSATYIYVVRRLRVKKHWSCTSPPRIRLYGVNRDKVVFTFYILLCGSVLMSCSGVDVCIVLKSTQD